MAGGMPILRKDDTIDMLRQLIYERNDLVAFGYGKASARAEIILNIDD
jgi:hypothetical protein